MIQVSELDIGTPRAIVEINAEPLLRNRLLEMGLIPGSFLSVKRYLPFGGPVIVQSGSITLALRREEAAKVWVSRD